MLLLAMPLLSGAPDPPINYRLRQLYRCAWHNCSHAAAGTLHAPDGIMIPGGYFCRIHGRGLVEDYADALWESWTFLPFPDNEVPA